MNFFIDQQSSWARHFNVKTNELKNGPMHKHSSARGVSNQFIPISINIFDQFIPIKMKFSIKNLEAANISLLMMTSFAHQTHYE